ncbi:TetR/AcrR family transcriptional regulator [Aquibium carbonis]|uniref:TetR/AcrR family transcriptional regulator n=1 Tax=Aquibium carbonis TaxID=2495581 RepID=A0A429YZJ0_9HYPH|nr:TetR/AcrR family transcriptional regulator [Aquibium carbonis]RST86871.1 TetR/AcrR family transcriptional regulator [Aquibium carbonis]
MNHTPTRLLDVCEQLLCQVDSVDEVTVRRLATAAGVTPSSVSYHFGSQERLIVATAERVYRRLNQERMSLLSRAVQRRFPAPPELEEVIAALVGPSVRWSLDPNSKYRVLAHFNSMSQRGKNPEVYRAIIEGVEHHKAFMAYLRQLAPWLDDAAIGWRMSCALGIRSQVTRSRVRNEVLTNHAIDFSDADEVIARIVEVVAPMFRRPS